MIIVIKYLQKTHFPILPELKTLYRLTLPPLGDFLVIDNQEKLNLNNKNSGSFNPPECTHYDVFTNYIIAVVVIMGVHRNL